MKYLIRNIKDINKNEIDRFYDNIYLYKKEKLDKCKTNNKKILSIQGEILLKELLKNIYNLDYKDIYFIINKNGKPFINNKNIYFNISHTNSYVITCISDKNIGVDIERIRKTNINSINQFASNNEKKYILSKKNNIYKRLFTIYTLKEAYIKSKGLSLNNIKDIEFTIDNEIVLCNDNTVNIELINIIKNHVIAIIQEK